MTDEPLRPAWSSQFAASALRELTAAGPIGEITRKWAWGDSTGQGAANTCTIFEGLTPAVEAAVGPLSREIYEDLKRRAPASEPPDSEDFRKRRAFYAPPTD